MVSLEHELFITFSRFLELLRFFQSYSSSDSKITFSPRLAILMSDIINNYTISPFDTSQKRVDLFEGCKMLGMNLGVCLDDNKKENDQC